MILGILLVDDMLDEDPRGLHIRIGDALAANLSFAFQAAAFRVFASSPVKAETRAAVMDSLAQMALTMAYGQDLDAQNLSGEDNYWKVTRGKSSSYFGTAMHIGALMGNAGPEVAESLRKLGSVTGEVIQIHDDLKDAMETPANPDWKQKRNNLLFLYTLTADHPDRERFLELRSRVDDPAVLREAQQILIRCGAVSYSLYHLCKRYQTGRQILENTNLVDPAPLQEVLVQYVRPVTELLRNLHIPIPPEIDIP
jgi:geranylgeranyl pyrophosphate synthase